MFWNRDDENVLTVPKSKPQNQNLWFWKKPQSKNITNFP